MPPAAKSDLLLVSVGEDVGFPGELAEHGVQSSEVVVEELLQVLLPIRVLQPVHVHMADLFPIIPLQDAPLNVIPDGFQQDVVAVHVSPGEIISSSIGVGDLFLHPLHVQGYVPQQAGHHDGLVHVIHSSNEPVHGIEQGVLLVVGIRYLHHGGGGL